MMLLIHDVIHKMIYDLEKSLDVLKYNQKSR
ncbi:hypothetical protein PG301_00280 [Parageobacillus sp. G301]|nr:hypothetical protein PG301_00280 [Parageobacillus sp. G301]